LRRFAGVILDSAQPTACLVNKSTIVMPFVDTNVLICAVSGSNEDRQKADRALGILSQEACVLSVQVLQEFYVQVTRPSRFDHLDHDEATAFIYTLLRFPVQAFTVDLLRAALATCRRFHLSYWDAAIIEAARIAGCDEVFSEDFSSGQDFNGVRVINPFA
jgi:predicted nucleic acid-binding protein